MIQEFVDRFDANRGKLLDKFKQSPPSEYKDIVSAVVEVLNDGGYDGPDPERIHCIDDGDYQGTLLFVIGARGYQPSTYWAVAVSYGSCSGCDTLEAIIYTPPDERAGEYLTLALHVVQCLRQISGYDMPSVE